MSRALRPRPLRPGDVIGVCAPAGAVDRDRLESGARELRRLGLVPRLSPRVLGRRFFTAGGIDERREDLQTFWADPEVAGIVCARGGAGALGLLPGLDRDLMAAHPKVFVGCSDATFLHLALGQLGQVTVHGPMVAGDLADGSYDEASFRQAVFGEGHHYASAPEELVTLRPGTAEGVLRGGCLSILASAAGTPWALQPDAEGTILFLEDVHERPYRVDRMLRQLRLSGALAHVRGLLFGDMRGCAPRLDEGYTLEAVMLDALLGLDIPIALGLSSGHTASDAISLPLGVRARLDCQEHEARFAILEPAVG
jgi:muramoyltetrapeptide carboxypeptidase